MFCPKCGQEVGDYTRICPACGELLENTATTGQQPQPQPERQGQYQPQPQPDQLGQYQPQPQPDQQGQYQPQPQPDQQGQYQPQPDQQVQYQPQPQFQGQPNYKNSASFSGSPQIPDYKVQSILLIVFSSILCCFGCISILALPFAIVALVNSNKIATHLHAGNIDLAWETSRKTKMWCWISFGILIASLVLVVIYYIYLFSSGLYDEIMNEFMNLQYQYDYGY